MYTDELKLQIATILNLLAIIASVVALFATKQMPAHIRVFVFVICIMALGTISACDLLSALLIGEGQMAVGIIVSLMSIALSIYMLIHIWGERVAIMGHFNYGMKLGIMGWIGYIILGIMAFIALGSSDNNDLLAGCAWICLIEIPHRIINHIFGINVVTVILAIVEIIIIGCTYITGDS